MEPDKSTLAQFERSPLASYNERIAASYALSEGPIRFLLVSGELDDATWGLVGAFWLSIDGSRGGFLVSPQAIWQGSEMVRELQERDVARLDRRDDLPLLAEAGRRGRHAA